MKISMMSYTLARGPWGRNPDVAELCRLTQELGLEVIDWVTCYGHDPHEIRRITDDHGLMNVCHTFMARVQSPDAAERAAAMDAVREGLEAAAALGADKVMIPLPGIAEVPREQTRAVALACLAEAVELAKPYGVTVTVEHFPGALSPFVTSEDMVLAAREVPGLKVTYDNGNLLTAGEDPADGFRRNAELVVHAHFKDWELAEEGLLGLDGRHYRGALVGDGLVDPVPCLAAMQECGYQGAINFEYEGNLYDPAEAMRLGIPRLQAQIDALG